MGQTALSCWWSNAVGAIAVAVCVAGPASAVVQEIITPDTLTDEHVQKAIAAIVEELYDRKHPTRFWEPARPPSSESKQIGGYTALTSLALLYAGQTYQDPRLRDAVASLEQLGMDGTYAVAVRANIWAMLPPKFHDLLVTDTRWLIDGFSEKVGGWTYRQTPNTSRRDNSITQYGALALWEAAKRNIPIDRRYWQMLEDRFLDMQLADGGWNYTGDGPATGSMTTAGLATLFITQDLLHAEEFLTTDGVAGTRYQKAIDRGLQWMDRNFSAIENPGRFRDYYYYLYGVERVGLASGYKYFGSHDWYREAAAEVIHRLCRWDATARTMTVHDKIGGDRRGARVRIRHLAFGLLFLSRGRVPVAINKLQTTDVAWNNRPRDVANITRWLQEKTESALNWQIVSINAAPHEWLDAPLLYLASDERLPWLTPPKIDVGEYVREVRRFHQRRAAGELPLSANPPERPPLEPVDKLKRYLDLGGLLFAVNEGRSPGFTQSVEQAGKLMYPLYDWRTLPNDHWAYTMLFPVRGKRPVLRGLSNGVRELIILSPSTDFSASFQAHRTNDHNTYLTAADIYLYASEMNRPRPRLAQHFSSTKPTPGPTGGLDSEALVLIARAVHEGNWNPEPQAMPLFSAVLAGTSEINISLVDCPLSQIHSLARPPTLVVVSGIEAHEFTPEQRQAIRAFVKNGGVILFETSGGRGQFTLSAEQACTAIFGEPIRSMLRTRIITGEGMPDAKRLTRLEYRPYALEVFAARETTPRLRGMMIDGQPRVLFSRLDITHGLLDQPCWGIAGYTSTSARDLLNNIVQHAAMLADQD